VVQGENASIPLDLKRVWDFLVKAVDEDVGSGDITSNGLIPRDREAEASIISRESGVLAGAPLISAIYYIVWGHMELQNTLQDGSEFEKGDVICRITGPARILLTGERIVLNFLQRLSGIATLTRRFVRAVEGTGAAIYDTRKTTPGLRYLEKYAVRVGGGRNHRMGLYDQVLIKDNHLCLMGSGAPGGTPDVAQGGPSGDAPGSVPGGAPGGPSSGLSGGPSSGLSGGPSSGLSGGTPGGPAGSDLASVLSSAVASLRDQLPPEIPIEVEAQDLDQVRCALEAGVDVIMLDNMAPQQMEEAVRLIHSRSSSGGQKRPAIEASGGIRLDNVRRVAETGVDRISVGALTHSAPALDIAMDIT
jgi:nicotinate-nucleotide pyrophosphorylase (carboxylating)